ncbi:hypothetical protein D3Z38_16880 [Clostridiales bacterium]|nr:hypothetical protein [Clostridiales bacterium]
MKENLLTGICLAMVPLPWTILYLRQSTWALESPVAEIMIAAYALFMIFSGGFTIWAYTKKDVRNGLMKACVIINSLYGAGGIAVLGMMVLPLVS